MRALLGALAALVRGFSWKKRQMDQAPEWISHGHMEQWAPSDIGELEELVYEEPNHPMAPLRRALLAKFKRESVDRTP